MQPKKIWHSTIKHNLECNSRRCPKIKANNSKRFCWVKASARPGNFLCHSTYQKYICSTCNAVSLLWFTIFLTMTHAHERNCSLLPRVPFHQGLHQYGGVPIQPTILISTSTDHYTPQRGTRAAEREASANQKRTAVPLTKAGRLNNKLKSFFGGVTNLPIEDNHRDKSLSHYKSSLQLPGVGD